MLSVRLQESDDRCTRQYAILFPLRLAPRCGACRRGFRGLGQSSPSTTQVATQVGGAVGGGLVATLVATGAIAGPVGALIGAGIGLVATLINSLFQPNYNKIAATNDVNSIEPYLKTNLANWLGLPNNQKFQSVQAAAIATANGWIQKMASLCQQVSGSAGQNCISQRLPGGCGFHVAQPYGWINGSFVPSGPNDPSGQYCWDWGYYVSSIQNDPNVIPDPSTTTAPVAAASQLSPATNLIAGSSSIAASTLASSSVAGSSLVSVVGLASRWCCCAGGAGMRLRGLLGLPAFVLYKVVSWLWAVLVLLAQAFVVVVGMVYMLGMVGPGLSLELGL